MYMLIIYHCKYTRAIPMFNILSLELLGTNNKLVGGCDIHTYFSYFYIIHVHHYHTFLLVLAILDHFGIIDDYMDLIQLLQIMPNKFMILIISDACGPIFLFLDFLYFSGIYCYF